MYFTLYRLATRYGGWLIDLWLLYRRRIGKEDAARMPERQGRSSIPRPGGAVVWIHAASVGEAMSVLPLLKTMLEHAPSLNALVTTGTVSSAKILEERLPARAYHQYVPVDKYSAVRRFLKHWRPDFALWVESELWPNLIMETQKRGCPMGQINARMSVHSFDFWQKYGDLPRRMLECFVLTLAQSEEDKERFTRLGAPNAKFVGNLKFDAPALPADPKATGQLVSQIGERPLWLAASTHAGEEEMFVHVHQKLKEKHEGLLTVIAPRHPQRGTEIAAIFSHAGLNAALRSKQEPIIAGTDVYVADTIGEMGIFYRLSSVVFMGGSLVPHGGQNPLEAARLECALLTGPHTNNFGRVYAELFEKKAARLIKNKQELTDQIDALLSDHEQQEMLADTALKLISSKEGVIDTYLRELSPYLKPLSTKATS